MPKIRRALLAAALCAGLMPASALAEVSAPQVGSPVAPAGASLPTVAVAPPGSAPAAALRSKLTPEVVPAGVNPTTCTPQRAVVFLIHGTDGTVDGDFSTLAPHLVAAGDCVYGVNYGRDPQRPLRGTAALPAAHSLTQLEQFARGIAATAPDTPITVVGFSQGGVLALALAHRLAEDYPVRAWVGISAPTQGALAYGAAPVLTSPPVWGSTQAVLGAGVADLLAGSPWHTQAEELTRPRPTIRYLTVVAGQDQFLHPPSQAAVPWAVNLRLDELCPGQVTAHLATPHDPATVSAVTDFLAGGTPRPRCGNPVAGSLSPAYGSTVDEAGHTSPSPYRGGSPL